MKAIVPTLALLLLLLPTHPVTPRAPASPGAITAAAPAATPISVPAVAARSGGPLAEPEPSFCLEGPVMSQLLEGFGCEDLAGRVEGSHLNCATRILRQEIVGGQARLDLVIECECEDTRASDAGIRQIGGEWRMIVDL